MNLVEAPLYDLYIFKFKKLSIAIELGGGTPMLMEEGTDDNDDDILLSAASCVMNADPTDPTQNISHNGQEWIQHVMAVLHK